MCLGALQAVMCLVALAVLCLGVGVAGCEREHGLRVKTWLGDREECKAVGDFE